MNSIQLAVLSEQSVHFSRGIGSIAHKYLRRDTDASEDYLEFLPQITQIGTD